MHDPLPPLLVLLTFTFSVREFPVGTSVSPEEAVIDIPFTAASTLALVPTRTNRPETGLVIVTPLAEAAVNESPSELFSSVKQSLTLGEAPNSILGRTIELSLGSKGTVPGVN